MAKVLIWFFLVSVIFCLILNGTAFFAEKILKRKTFEKAAKKEE